MIAWLAIGVAVVALLLRLGVLERVAVVALRLRLGVLERDVARLRRELVQARRVNATLLELSGRTGAQLAEHLHLRARGRSL